MIRSEHIGNLTYLCCEQKAEWGSTSKVFLAQVNVKGEIVKRCYLPMEKAEKVFRVLHIVFDLLVGRDRVNAAILRLCR